MPYGACYIDMRTADKKFRRQLFNTIQKRALRKRDPLGVMFELTYRCNFHCPHCYLTETMKEGIELNTAQVLFILEQLKEIGVCTISFTGGEPLIRKDIFEILGFANRCGFKFSLLTNGSLIDEKAARALKEVNVGLVEITLNAMEPEIFDKLSGTKGVLGNVKRAIEILAKKDMQVRVKSLVTISNKEEAVKINRYTRRLNIPYGIDGMIWPSHDSCFEIAHRYSLEDSDQYHIRRQVYPEMFKRTIEAPKAGKRLKRKRIFECDPGVTGFTVNSYGKMNFCFGIDYPNYDILKEGVEVCWNRLKKEVDKINSAVDFACRTCDLSGYCVSCPAMSYMETGRFDRCSEFSKKKALLRKEGA